MIAVAATERFRGGSRVTFLCGGRALAGYRRLRDAVAGSVRALSVLPDGAARGHRAAAGGRQGSAQADQGLPGEARGPGGRRAGGRRGRGWGRPGSWRRRSPGWDAAGLKLIAARIVERPGHVAVLVGDPPPAADRRGAFGGPAARRGSPPAPARRAARGKGRRPPRARPGRRRHVPGSRRATVRTGPLA